jgi:signal peptidase II
MDSRSAFLINWIRSPTFKWVAFAVLLIIDRAAKFLMSSYLAEKLMEENVRFFSLSLHHNTGISFSFLQNYPSAGLAASILGIAIFGFLCLKIKSLRSRAGVVFLWAGAIGNLTDKLLYGYVIDWLYIGIYINLADIWLCAGFIMLALIPPYK